MEPSLFQVDALVPLDSVDDDPIQQLPTTQSGRIIRPADYYGY